jgi:hypothetical protein
MDAPQESPTDRLWREYALAFQDFDDLTLARWMAQTLGQLAGKSWRFSHPLVGTYRLACQVAQKRQIWLKRLVSTPSNYAPASCCRAPLLPFFTRDIATDGLICFHCNEIIVPFDELPGELCQAVGPWAEEYARIHQVAHWEEPERRRCQNYDQAVEDAACTAEKLLLHVGTAIVPAFLGHYPAIIWEDQDECLDVQPEDVQAQK